MATIKEPPAPKAAPVFEHDVCLYRAGAEGAPEAEARVFRADEEIPPKSEGWVGHPSLTRDKKGAPA